MTFRTERRVEFRDTDSAGIMHFSCFFVWMEQAEHEALRSLGLSVMDKTGPENISWPRVSAKCDFFQPARFEDILNIEVAVEEIGSKSVTFAFTILRKHVKLAAGSLTTVCCRVHEGKIDPHRDSRFHSQPIEFAVIFKNLSESQLPSSVAC